MSDQEQRKNELTTLETGSFDLTNLSSQLTFAQSLLSNGVVSDTFKTPQQIVIGIQYAISMKLEVIPALRQMFVLNGVPNLFGDGPLMMVQKTGKLESIKEYFVDNEFNEICVKNKNLNKEVYAAVCRVKRVGDNQIQEDFFSVDNMNEAGTNLTNRGEKLTWRKYRRIMMRYRARTMALKSKFADLMNGIEVSEYMHNYTPEVPEINNPEQKEITKKEIRSDLLSEDLKPQTIEIKNQKPEVVQSKPTFRVGE